MLKLEIPKHTDFNESTLEFLTPFKGATIQLEHSLVSISKWERKWEKPFLSKDKKTDEESIDYIRCMTITQNVDQKAYEYLTKKNIEDVNRYIDAKMTAAIFKKSDNKESKEIITAETIYFWMIANQIPIEFQKWHLNSLLALIRTCSEKNKESSKSGDNEPKMSKSEIYRRNKEINMLRRKECNSKG